MTKDVVLVTKEDDICTITMNRPERKNAMNPQVLHRLCEEFGSIGKDGRTRAVVLRGASEQAFSTGYDIASLRGEGSLDTNRINAAFKAIEDCPVPVIAMIYGYCIAGGVGIAASCDLRIAADNAQLGMSFARLGVIFTTEGTVRFLRLVGASTARMMLYTGRLIDAREALRIGLVDRVTSAGQLPKVTYGLAREIADNAPLSVMGAKAAINKLLLYQEPGPEVQAEIAAIRKQVFGSEDREEGHRAFREKRKGLYKGR